MCGFFCIYNSAGKLKGSEKRIRTAGRLLKHRGPDDEGFYMDDHFGVHFSRLSIMDPSDLGHQPMISFCQRYVIIFNGEIYNHLELRELFPFHAWNGTSDTETLLTMISKVGIKETLEKIEGMFSFAIWDKQKKKITLARDKIGEKPLYYGWCNGFFVFASELKALTAYENFNPELDNKSVSLYFQYGYIPGELSIYKGIKKLKPGCYIEIYKNNHNSYSESVLNSYWDLEEVASRSNSDEFKGGIGDAITQLNNYLSSAIDMQKNSDVPVLLLLNKIDLVEQEEVSIQIEYWKDKVPNAEILPISALNKFNIRISIVSIFYLLLLFAICS